MSEIVAHWDGLGWIVFAIVIGSLGCVMLASLLIKSKKKSNATGVFLGSIVALAVGFVALTGLGAMLLGVFVP